MHELVTLAVNIAVWGCCALVSVREMHARKRRARYQGCLQRNRSLELELGLREPTATERQIAGIVAAFTGVQQALQSGYERPSEK